MRWPDVTLALATAAASDATLAGIYGDNIRAKGVQQYQAPSLEYLLVSDVETELWEPVVVQWDQYAPTEDDLIASERRLRALFSHELAVTIEGVTMFCEFLGGESLSDAPTRENTYARAVRFVFEPLRGALQRP
jgi:hypothetical protein